MKLLIADDEILTRNGLVTSIDWKSLGIDQVFEAADGMEAYNTACTSKPDIILSDIRMPRLSGIEFAEKIKEILHPPESYHICRKATGSSGGKGFCPGCN